MQVSRRMFLGSMGAAAGFRAFGAPQRGKPELKLALLSDPHVQDAATQAKIRKIFAYARVNGVDGVLIAGDIANDGRDDQLKMVADAWFEVFPNSKGADGERVEIIGCYGNRDFRQSSVTKPGQREREAAISIFSHPNAIWQELFHDPIGDEVCVRHVKGYPVVVAHWRFQNKLKEFWPDLKKKFDPSKTFFYVQHPHLSGTVFNGFKADSGVSKKILSAYPNAIALSGHSHRSITDERALWHDSFVSLAGGSGAFVSIYEDRPYENHGNLGLKKGVPPPRVPHMAPALNTHGLSQVMILSLYPDTIEIVRHDCGFDESAGPDWILPRGKGNADQPFGAVANPDVPQFPADAKVSIAERMGKNRKGEQEAQFVVSFPPAQPCACSSGRVMEYEVSAQTADGSEIVKEYVFATNHLHPCKEVKGPVECVFGKDSIPQGVRPVWCVTPCNFLHQPGKSIRST